MRTYCANGWNIYFHPLFNDYYSQLRSKVVQLQSKLLLNEFESHCDVKLYTNLLNIIVKIIPNDPFAHYFVLTSAFKKYSRVKGKGLDERRRLFFKVFREESTIVILWLGYPRKEGSKKDCYNIFGNMVSRGIFPDNFDDLRSVIEEFNVLETDYIPPSLEL